MQRGLPKGSFISPEEIHDLRDLTRLRVRLTEAHTRVQTRIEKVLRDANLKLGAVAAETLGATGRRILAAQVRGQLGWRWHIRCSRLLSM